MLCLAAIAFPLARVLRIDWVACIADLLMVLAFGLLAWRAWQRPVAAATCGWRERAGNQVGGAGIDSVTDPCAGVCASSLPGLSAADSFRAMPQLTAVVRSVGAD